MKLEDIHEQPELIVMVGLPGSGKSTWRDKFIANADIEYVIISSDDELETMATDSNSTYSDVFKAGIGKATAIAKQKFREAVNSGSNIIWDQTNLSLKKRRGILQQVPNSYRKIAVVFEVTDDELQSRLSNRERETGKHIPPKVVKNMANSYTPPSKSEGFDEVKFI